MVAMAGYLWVLGFGTTVGAGGYRWVPIVDILLDTYSECCGCCWAPVLGVGTYAGHGWVLLGAPVSPGIETKAITELVLWFFSGGV